MVKKEEIEKWKKAGKIAMQVMKYAESILKPDMKLLELAEKIEKKIFEMKAKPSFPVTISCNEIAAHYTPSDDDKNVVNGLVKVDLGVSIDGYISDTACSFDLSEEKKYVRLIESSREALSNAIKIIKPGIKLREIGSAIQKTISDYGFSSIRNLSGHELKPYKLHAGLSIPNYDNGNENILREGQVIAVEPFSTSGEGLVQDGKPAGDYMLLVRRQVRDMFTRKILDYIEEEYKTLPFTSRWLVKKFGKRSLIALHLLEQAGCLYQYKQLIEKSRKEVAQSEHTLLVTKEGNLVTTKKNN